MLVCQVSRQALGPTGPVFLPRRRLAFLSVPGVPQTEGAALRGAHSTRPQA